MKKIDLAYLLVFAFILFTMFSCEKDTNVESPDNTEQNDDNGEYFSTSIANALAENCSDHESNDDYTWTTSDVFQIALNGSSISTTASGVTVSGSKATITKAGTYSLSGTLTDGQLIVNSDDNDAVRLILNNASIACSTSAPIYIKNAEKTIVVLADNTSNSLVDGSSYVFENSDDDEPNAALFSKDDLTIYGGGELTVDANYNDGIASKDGLIIKSGTINITSVDDGIRGKDYLIIKGGNITLNVAGDGLKSDNDEDVSKGYILVESGSINITSGNDAIQAETDALISYANVSITAGGGSSYTVDDSESAKGIKGLVNTIIDDGTFVINSADDAVHSNGNMVIDGGNFMVSSGDDGFHSDSLLTINGGEINVEKSYEGIESAIITINDGDIHVVSSDDGINGAGGNDSSGTTPSDPWANTSTGNYYLYINGGYIYVNTNGDGVDVNGSIEMAGGTLIVNGPTANDNGALDYDVSFKLSSGYLLAAGSSGMAQAPSTTSTQNSVSVTFGTARQAGTLFHIQSSDGTSILTFAPVKRYQSVVFSSTQLTKGATYDIYLGGSSTGTPTDGLYKDGTYSGGTKSGSFTISGTVTKVNIQ